ICALGVGEGIVDAASCRVSQRHDAAAINEDRAMSEGFDDHRGGYQRGVLKVSGESFAAAGERGISLGEVVLIAEQVYKAAQRGVQIAIVIGGGNILRGAQFTAGNSCIQEATAHYMGMLATVINGLALQDGLESLGCQTRLLTAIRMDGVA